MFRSAVMNFQIKDFRCTKMVQSFLNGRKCNAQNGEIVSPTEQKSQSLIGKVIASPQLPLEAQVVIETVSVRR